MKICCAASMLGALKELSYHNRSAFDDTQSSCHSACASHIVPAASSTAALRSWACHSFAAFLLSCGLLGASLSALGAETNELTTRIQNLQEKLNQTETKLSRQINELIWFQHLEDIATVDKMRFTGPPSREKTGEARNDSSNHVIVAALTFMPRER